jgi:hypothetical protein
MNFESVARPGGMVHANETPDRASVALRSGRLAKV